MAWLLGAGLTVPNLLGGSHTWSGAVNGNWSTAGNWSAGGVPTIGEASLTMTFPGSATRKVMTNDIGALTVNSMNFSGSNYIVRGASAVTFGSSLINVLCSGNSNTIESTLNLPGNFAVSVGDNKVMAFHTLTGAGTLLQFGEGEIHLRGGANNSLSGGYIINIGRLVLAKTGGATAVAAPLTIVGTTNFGQLAFVSLAGSEQIAGNVNVIIHPTGGLYLNGFTNTINDLTVMAGAMDGSGGLLRLNGDIRLSALDGAFPLPDTSPIIRGNLEFIGASNNITVSNLTCEIEANIVEYGGATALGKDGLGTLWLKGGGNNPGNIYVNAGTLRAGTAASLGTISGSTTVANGASLIISSGVGTAEPLTLSGLGTDGQGALKLTGGTANCSGLITLGSEAGISVPSINDTLNLDGPISGGGGIRKFGDGTLSLNGFGNNTFSGASFVAKGKLTLNKSANVRALGSVTVTNGASLVFNNNELMDNAGILSIYANASVNLTNRTETIGGLNTGTPHTLDMGTGTLTLLGNLYAGPPYENNDNVNPAIIRGQLSLGGATRNIRTTNYSTLMFDCNITDGAGVGGLNIQGGTWLMRSNSFTGPVTLDGFCRVSNNWAFGAPGGGVSFATNAVYVTDMFLYGMTAISGETLTVGSTGFNYLTPLGTNGWNGSIVFTNGSSLECDGFGVTDLTLAGPISGSNTVLSSSGGTLRLLGTNTYTGLTKVFYDTLVMGNPQALGSTNQGTELRPEGSLVMSLGNGAHVAGEPLLLTDTAFYTNRPTLRVLGSVSNSWSGPVTNLAALLKVRVEDAAGTFVLASIISGPGSLEKQGPGRLILAGTNANTYSGETIVTQGTLRLNKPNGVRATADLSVYSYVGSNARLEWGANEQIADTATLKLIQAGSDFTDRSETITRLVMQYTSLASGTGALTLLGDIELPPYDFPGFDSYNVLEGSLVLGPGTHRIINPNTNIFAGYVYFTLDSSTRETGGTSGLWMSGCGVTFLGSNSFTGPVIVDGAALTVKHPQALGSPAQGTLLTNFSRLNLAMPNGSVLAGESLVITPPTPGAFGPNILSMNGFETNTWAGEVTLQGSNDVYVGIGCQLTIDGPVFGPGVLNSDGNGALILAGAQANTITGLIVDDGLLRLAKSPGVLAFTGDVVMNTDGLANKTPTVMLDAPGQFPPQTTFVVGVVDTNAVLNLNGQPAVIRGLSGYGTANLGTGTLTLSNDTGGFSFPGITLGAPGGTRLVKQGVASQGLFGSNALNGDVFVQGGTLGLVNATIGGMNLSAGTLVNVYGPFSYFGSLSGAGNLSPSGNGLLFVGANNLSTTFSGVILDYSQTNLIKVGTGTLTLSGASTNPGKTVIQNGTILVNGSLAGPVHVQPGAPGQLPTLGGVGTLGNVVVTGLGARIAPGATTSIPSYGKLTVTNLALDGGALYLGEVGGTNAGVNLDQLDVTETTTLLNCGATFTTLGTGAVSNRYVVLKSFAAVNGTFSGKSEGSTFSPSTGRLMQITYVGGASGRDIVLMDLAAIPPGSFSGIQVLPNGQVQVGGTGTPGALYDVQANANLNTTNWILIGTATGDFNGAFSFIDTNAPAFPMRFYRFLLP